MALSVISFLVVGSDYNLLLFSRFKKEIHTGLKMAIIRSMAGTGGVVTVTVLVCAFTMTAMLNSELQVISQFGTIVCIGPLIVRTLLVPSIATLLGRWFWWPQKLSIRTETLPGRV
nr:MMPL family transporter [Mycobacterium lepromatosis]